MLPDPRPHAFPVTHPASSRSPCSSRWSLCTRQRSCGRSRSASCPATSRCRSQLRKLGVDRHVHADRRRIPTTRTTRCWRCSGHGQGMRTVLVTATRGDGGQNEIGPGAVPVARRAADRGAAGRASLRRRRAVLHARDRLRLLVQRRGIDREVGARRDRRRLRPPHPRDPARRHRRVPLRRRGRRPASPGLGAADARSVPRGGRSGAVSRADREGLRPWQAKRVFCTDTTSFAPAAQRDPHARSADASDVSAFDPVLGRTYGELGLEARCMHKCQGTSQLLPLPGQSFNRTYRLRDSVIGQPGVAPTIALRRHRHHPARPARRSPGARPPAASAAGVHGDRRRSRRTRTTALGTQRSGGRGARRWSAGWPRSARCARQLAVARAVGRRALRDRLPARAQGGRSSSRRIVARLRHAVRGAGGRRRGDARAAGEALARRRRTTAADDVTHRRASTSRDSTGASASCAGDGAEGGRPAPAPATGTIPADATDHRARTGRRGRMPRATTSSRTRRSAVPFRPSPFQATFALSIGGADVAVDRTLAVPLRQRRRRREADGAAGRAGLLGAA